MAKSAVESLSPMEARSVDTLPVGEQWQYEPKWDGFRCVLTRNGTRVTMRSKSGQDLKRYFPEVADAALQLREQQFTLDGELIIPIGQHISFDALLQRIHPAASRIMRLSQETPALFVAFDLLRCGAKPLDGEFLPKRRAALEQFAKRCLGGTRFRLSPASTRLADGKKWLKAAGGISDGVIAKRRDLPYQAGNREGMQKVKLYRSADCVVGGFRYAERPVAGKRVVGSLLLGVYDDQGQLQHVGFTSALKDEGKLRLTQSLEAITTDQSFSGRIPGAPSRWSNKRSSEWTAVRPKLVVEVSYDHFTGGRFRHGTGLLRWRPDKKPKLCTLEQLQQKSVRLSTLLAAR